MIQVCSSVSDPFYTMILSLTISSGKQPVDNDKFTTKDKGARIWVQYF